jgi:lipoate-protein ligase B
MRLAYLHLPNTTPFSRVSEIQQALTTRLLTHKKLTSPGFLSSQEPRNPNKTPSNTHLPPPDPTIITFTPNPVYTTGRRDLPPSNTRPPHTTANLSLPPALEPIRSLLTPNGTNPPKAEYHPTLRGGQTTYHGPGQMVAYTILDLKRLGLTPRCHIRVLENSVIDLLGRYGVEGFTTEDPGVWVSGSSGQGQGHGQAKKITAVGVHLRRNISSFGIGLNVTDEPMWFFKQIVACGLEGKEATSLQGVGVAGLEVGDVADGFVERFVERVNRDFACGENSWGERIEEVYRVGEEDLLGSS